MRYHNITKDDMNNGDGLRAVLWLSGCDHCCEGCQNPITWDPNGGLPFDSKAKEELFGILEKDYTSGITFSGGDPLYIGNRMDVTSLAKEITKKFPDKTIWMYTGFYYEDVAQLEVMNYVDVLVDGPFVLAKRDTTLHWVGSGNQRVIDVKETRKQGKVILHETPEVDTRLIEKMSSNSGCML
ncbi:MAG: anaerobic ribonucleoside-triphosphate reductase activating protein [Lachnospiraceae bacterium]|nr:anaerobic ribonucleoside-triphosphate reductase activating protein [Lachnospiraceae bacterium]